MRTPVRLLLIVLLAPALAHVAAGVVLLAPLLIVTAPVSYPICVLATAVALPVLHAAFQRRIRRTPQQLGVVLAAGVALGLVAYLLLSWRLTLSAPLAAWYCSFGLVNGLMCWALYNWGPLSGRGHVSLEQRRFP
jgi:hypothetical protein